MSNNNNQLNIPQAKEAMNKFMMQAASEAGSVGGQMVSPIRTKFDRNIRTALGHIRTVGYIVRISV